MTGWLVGLLFAIYRGVTDGGVDTEVIRWQRHYDDLIRLSPSGRRSFLIIKTGAAQETAVASPVVRTASPVLACKG